MPSSKWATVGVAAGAVVGVAALGGACAYFLLKEEDDDHDDFLLLQMAVGILMSELCNKTTEKPSLAPHHLVKPLCFAKAASK